MKKKAPAVIDEGWMSTYGDLVTLLLCFFVMMLAASTPDAAKYEQIQAGLNEGVGKQEPQQRPIEMMMVELSDDIQSMDVEDKISLATDAQGIVLEFDGSTLFDYGSATIKPDAIPSLKRIAATLQSDRYQKFIFSIEGHTSDEKFSSPQFPSNWELSAARAASVARFLEERGISRVRLRVAGLYDVSPKYPNRDPFGDPIPQNRVKNRRVVIHVEPSFK